MRLKVLLCLYTFCIVYATQAHANCTFEIFNDLNLFSCILHCFHIHRYSKALINLLEDVVGGSMNHLI